MSHTVGMSSELPPGAFDGVYVARGAGDVRVLARACETGRLLRLRAGAYVDAALWREAEPRQRSLLRVQAVAASRDFRDVLSHQTAAVVAGLTLLTEPTAVHATVSTARSTRSRSGLILHSAGLDSGELEHRAPFTLTNAPRTVADVLLEAPFSEAVALLDGALRSKAVTLAEVAAFIERSARTRGRASAARTLAFADPGAANAGESLSRVLIAQLGFAAPTLQEPFSDSGGAIGFTDFWWREAGVIGEYDGFAKYSKPEYLRGRTPSQVVVAEKKRERRLEALPQVSRVARWVWSDLLTPARLFRELSTAGVPRASGLLH